MRTNNLNEFIKATCSKSPTPGGGSVAALLASLSAALAAMSANLTVNKKGYEDVSEDMYELANKFESKANKYLDYMKKDIDAFNGVMSAYKLSKDDLNYRKHIIQVKTKEAMEVPFSLAKEVYDTLDDIKYCYYNSNKSIQSDALMAMIIARCVIMSSLCNVYINLNSLKDESIKKEINDKCLQMKNKVNELEKELINSSPYFKI